MPSVSEYNHSDHLAYLVNEVYRPRIEEHVKFGDVIPNMPFMSHIMAQIYKIEKTGARKEAAEIFFSHLKDIEEEGKYQSFVEALRKARYPVLVSALENKEVILSNEEEHNQLINLFFSDIIDVIDPERLSQELQSKEVITWAEGGQIRKTAEKSPRDAGFELLLKIPHRTVNWYEIFLDLLLEHGHNNLVKKIDPKFFAKKRGNAGDELSSINPETELSLPPAEEDPSYVETDALEDPSYGDADAQSTSSATQGSHRKSDLETSANKANYVSPVTRSTSQGTKGISVNDFQAKVLNELAELKLLFQGQTKCLQDLLEKTELIDRRVERLESKLESVRKPTSPVRHKT